MTEEVMKLLLSSMTEETDDAVLSAYLQLARLIILNRLYPYQDALDNGAEVPSRYYDLQIRIAAYHLNKRGAEQETMHVENGITRMYESADTPSSLLGEITPFASVPGSSTEDEDDPDDDDPGEGGDDEGDDSDVDPAP